MEFLNALGGRGKKRTVRGLGQHVQAVFGVAESVVESTFDVAGDIERLFKPRNRTTAKPRNRTTAKPRNRTTATKACRHGDQCYATNCRFTHPSGNKRAGLKNKPPTQSKQDEEMMKAIAASLTETAKPRNRTNLKQLMAASDAAEGGAVLGAAESLEFKRQPTSSVVAPIASPPSSAADPFAEVSARSSAASDPFSQQSSDLFASARSASPPILTDSEKSFSSRTPSPFDPPPNNMAASEGAPQAIDDWRALLNNYKLGRFSAEMEEMGYDVIEDWPDLTNDDLAVIGIATAQKSGHLRKWARLLKDPLVPGNARQPIVSPFSSTPANTQGWLALDQYPSANIPPPAPDSARLPRLPLEPERRSQSDEFAGQVEGGAAVTMPVYIPNAEYPKAESGDDSDSSFDPDLEPVVILSPPGPEDLLRSGQNSPGPRS